MKSYAGIEYIMIHRKGKRCIRLESKNLEFYTDLGADLTLLDDIGRNGDPGKAIKAMLDGIPPEKK